MSHYVFPRAGLERDAVQSSGQWVIHGFLSSTLIPMTPVYLVPSQMPF